MSASVRTRQSLEPLAAALLAIGLIHALIGFVAFSIVPELYKRTTDKRAAKLIWHAPADFLLVKSVKAEPPVAVATPKIPLIPPPAVSAVKAPETQLTQSIPAVIPMATSTAKTPSSQRSLAAVLQANSGAVPWLNDTSLMGAGSMPLTINTVGPIGSLKPQEPMLPVIPTKTEALLVPHAMPAAPVPPPVVTENPPSLVTSGPSSLGNQKEANKYITLSAILAPGKAPAKLRENKPYLNLLDIANLNANERAKDTEAGGADMGTVEKALQQAILKEWTAPQAQAVPPSQRRATMEITILRDGTIADASMKTASGSSLLDASIRLAADRLKKIPVTLPSEFPKERYELRVNFQIE